MQPSNTILSKFLYFIRGNEKLVLFVVALVIVFGIMITTIISMNNTLAKPQQTTNETTFVPSISPLPTSVPTLQPQPTQSTTQQQQTQIVTDTKPQLSQSVSVSYSIASVKQYGSAWAIMKITNPSTDPAHVVVHNENGRWIVKLGPGTYFTPEQLQAIGAPANLTDEVNKDL